MVQDQVHETLVCFYESGTITCESDSQVDMMILFTDFCIKQYTV